MEKFSALSQLRSAEFEKRRVIGSTLSDFDEEKLREYFRQRAPGAEEIDHLSLAELAVGQGFMARINGEHLPTVAGIMLFGKSPQKHKYAHADTAAAESSYRPGAVGVEENRAGRSWPHAYSAGDARVRLSGAAF